MGNKKQNKVKFIRKLIEQTFVPFDPDVLVFCSSFEEYNVDKLSCQLHSEKEMDCKYCKALNKND